MSQEQDQEKLLNATAQVLNNSLSGAINIASLRKSTTKIEVKTAKDDIHNARFSLQKGVSIDKIRNIIAGSPVAKKVEQAGGNVSKYVNSIVMKAKVDNKINTQPNREIVEQKAPKRNIGR